MIQKISTEHLQRRAVVYLRQSSLRQVQEHRESTQRQYALRDRALQLGWPENQIEVVDEDLGQSATTAQGRAGFQRLGEGVAQRRVGAIFTLEVSRLARSSADWHRLLDLCGLANALLVDEHAVYDPCDHNDRLLLGLKGTMSEAELYWMRLRLHGGILNKARRGEFFLLPPVGYRWDPIPARFVLDPDERVQQAVRLVFQRFRIDGAAAAVVRYFRRQGLFLPKIDRVSHEIRWVPTRDRQVLYMLRNPQYTGTYVFGRREVRTALIDGEVKRSHCRALPIESWKVRLENHHPAYLPWEEFVANQERLLENGRCALQASKAPREGAALLQGIVLCSVCGHRMAVRHQGESARRRVRYQCVGPYEATGRWLGCTGVPALGVDQAVADHFLSVMRPAEIDLAFAVAREAEKQAEAVDRQWALQMERARYDARLAERRYKAADPDNRVVIRTLERDWEDKLVEAEAVEKQYHELRRSQKLDLTDEDRRRIAELARDLPQLWNAATTRPSEKKNLLRILIEQVALTPIETPRREVLVKVQWRTGATTELRVPLPERNGANPAESVRLIEELEGRRMTHQQIAAELNRRGLKTGRDRAWTVRSVRTARGTSKDQPAQGPR